MSHVFSHKYLIGCKCFCEQELKQQKNEIIYFVQNEDASYVIGINNNPVFFFDANSGYIFYDQLFVTVDVTDDSYILNSLDNNGQIIITYTNESINLMIYANIDTQIPEGVSVTDVISNLNTQITKIVETETNLIDLALEQEDLFLRAIRLLKTFLRYFKNNIKLFVK